MMLAVKPHPVDKLAWVGLIAFSLLFWWPLGLAILAYLLWSGKMRCWHSDRLSDLQRHGFERFFHVASRCCGNRRQSTSSGNTAFDAYRNETLRRLEEDQREFADFLDRLRRARDQAEFEQFMAEQNRRRENPEPPEEKN
jgi:hypothetical protein